MSDRELESLREQARWSTTWLKVTFLPAILVRGTCRLWVVLRFSALRAALMVLSARLINSVRSLEDFPSEFGDINILRIFLFSSSCMGLTILFVGLGEFELEATEEMLSTEGFLSPSLPSKCLCPLVLGERLTELVASSKSAVSEAKDICGVRKLV